MGRLLLISSLCFFLFAGAANAITWTIKPDGTGDAPTIQAGINYAGPGDVVLVMAGTYYEHDIWLKSGVALTSETGLRDCVTIDAEGLGRVFACSELDNTTSIAGFTAVNGTALQGGGMYCYDSDASFTECRFMNNSAADTSGVKGGGVYLGQGVSVFTDCEFSWNSAVCTLQGYGCHTGEGGGFYGDNGAPRFIRCTFSHNTVDCDCEAVGGGFSCRLPCSPTFEECSFDTNTAGGVYIPYYCDAEFTGCAFRGNSAAPYCVGGGMVCRSDDVVITDCLFEGNSCPEGGGINLRYASPTLTGCRFYDNCAGSMGGGGAFIDDGSSPTFINCVFAGNHAPVLWWGTGGGGVLVRGGCSPEFVGCTFSANSTTERGGGIFCGPNSQVTLDRCIVAYSTDGEALYWGGTGVEPELNCCDLYGNQGGDWVGEIADQYGVNGNISVDPVFCDRYGYDFQLSTDSPCLDADTCGTIGAYGAGCSLTFSILHMSDHPGDHGGAVDITWHRIGYDSAASDTVVDYYSVWRWVEGPAAKALGTPEVLLSAGPGDPPGTWVRMDSVPASLEFNYTRTCSTACDSTEAGGLCWSVFYIKAHCSAPVLEFETEPDSGYSVINEPPEAWTDVTTTPPLGNTEWGHGFAWLDYDKDDDLDIFVANRLGSDKLFRNDSLTAGGFVNATPGGLDDYGDCRGAAWGDYDNDGDPDLYVSKNGANRLLRNNGGGGFSDVSAPPLDDSGIGQTVSWADYDEDGDLDLYLVNNGANRLFRNDGAGVFTGITGGCLEDTSHGMGSGWADYDRDGDLDLYIANYDAANVLIENQGGGVFIDATTPVLAITAPSVGVAWGDYDNDGDLDLYVTNEGSNTMLRNDDGGFVDVTASPLDDDDIGRSAAWGDYDLDGDLDLYLVNYDGPNRLFKNLGGGVFVIPECAAAPITDEGKGFSMGWGDYDKDGDLDIYVVNDGRNGLFRNDLYSERHWLEVRLVGSVSNTYGQGARVRIVAGYTSQMREIAGASGYLSQGPLTAFFGLGIAVTVDTVEVTWPVGDAIQVLTDIACDQTLTIFESNLAGAPGDAEKASEFRLYPGIPNPFSSVTSVRYDLPVAARVDLEVFDVSGRLVRRLIDHRPTEPGRHTALWGGRNESGQPVGPGIYFCRLSAGSKSQIQRLVLLR